MGFLICVLFWIVFGALALIQGCNDAKETGRRHLSAIERDDISYWDVNKNTEKLTMTNEPVRTYLEEDAHGRWYKYAVATSGVNKGKVIKTKYIEYQYLSMPVEVKPETAARWRRSGML